MVKLLGSRCFSQKTGRIISEQVAELIRIRTESEICRYSESIFDSFSFIELHRHYSQFDLGKHKDLLGKIKLACRIPSLAKEKDTKPRDHLFELELACFLDSKHFGVKAYDDIQILVGNTPVIIECKRLSSPKKVGENVKKAVTQLQEYFDANNDCKKGCVALSFDKIIDFNGNLGKENSLASLITPVGREFNAQEKAIQLSNEIGKRYRHFWTKIIDIRIIAVIHVIRFAVRIQEIEHVYYFPIFVPLVGGNSCCWSDQLLIQEIERMNQ